MTRDRVIKAARNMAPLVVSGASTVGNTLMVNGLLLVVMVVIGSSC